MLSLVVRVTMHASFATFWQGDFPPNVYEQEIIALVASWNRECVNSILQYRMKTAVFFHCMWCWLPLCCMSFISVVKHGLRGNRNITGNIETILVSCHPHYALLFIWIVWLMYFKYHNGHFLNLCVQCSATFSILKEAEKQWL